MTADQALGQLAAASLLTFSIDGATVTAHRLVTRVTRDHLTATRRLTATCQAAAGLLDSQAQTLNDTWHHDRAATRDLIEQITALHQATTTCPGDDRLDRSVLRARWWAKAFISNLGDNLAGAVQLGEAVLADSERLLGTDHPDTLTARHNLANAYQAAGRTTEAITLHEQNLADRQRVLGPDHPRTLTSRNNLANAYQDAGRTTEAITLHERTLADSQRLLGPDHPDTLNSRNNLANAYQDAGRTPDAAALMAEPDEDARG